MKTLTLNIENYTIEVPVFARDGRYWVALKPICEALGVAWKRQHAKFTDDSVIPHMVTTGSGSDGKRYEMLCIEVDCIGEWIFGINPKKVSPEIRDRMIVFRRKLQSVLYAAVTGHLNADMIASMTKEIQDLKSHISTLQHENSLKDARIERLENRLEDMAMQICYNSRVDESNAGRSLNLAKKAKVFNASRFPTIA